MMVKCAGIQVKVPFVGKDHTEQTRCSLYTRIGTAAFGAIAALVGILTLAGIPGLCALGVIGGSIFTAVGVLTFLAAIFIRQAKEQASPSNPSSTETPPSSTSSSQPQPQRPPNRKATASTDASQPTARRVTLRSDVAAKPQSQNPPQPVVPPSTPPAARAQQAPAVGVAVAPPPPSASPAPVVSATTNPSPAPATAAARAPTPPPVSPVTGDGTTAVSPPPAAKPPQPETPQYIRELRQQQQELRAAALASPMRPGAAASDGDGDVQQLTLADFLHYEKRIDALRSATNTSPRAGLEKRLQVLYKDKLTLLRELKLPPESDEHPNVQEKFFSLLISTQPTLTPLLAEGKQIPTLVSEMDDKGEWEAYLEKVRDMIESSTETVGHLLDMEKLVTDVRKKCGAASLERKFQALYQAKTVQAVLLGFGLPIELKEEADILQKLFTPEKELFKLATDDIARLGPHMRAILSARLYRSHPEKKNSTDTLGAFWRKARSHLQEDDLVAWVNDQREELRPFLPTDVTEKYLEQSEAVEAEALLSFLPVMEGASGNEGAETSINKELARRTLHILRRLSEEVRQKHTWPESLVNHIAYVHEHAGSTTTTVVRDDGSGSGGDDE